MNKENRTNTKSDNINIQEHIALLDALQLNNIKILHIKNFENLVNRQILEISNSPAIYCCPDGQMFTRLYIENDGVIDRLIAGSKIVSHKKIDYCNMQVTIKNSEIGNLICYTVEQYCDKLHEIQKHLENKYGIITDFTNVSLKKIEINRTICLDENFENYHRIFNLIMSNLPKYLQNQMDFRKSKKNDIKFETYCATSARKPNSERHINFKIYDKSKALESSIIITNSYMRTEFTISGTERIKKSLGTNCFKKLTDKTINDFFNTQIHKIIVTPFEKWQKERNKYIIRLMKEQRQTDIRHWQTNVLRILQNEEIKQKSPVLLDITEIMPLIDYLNLTPRRKYDIRVNFRKQANKYENVFCNNDNAKMDEILTKLTTVKSRNHTTNIPCFGGITQTA